MSKVKVRCVDGEFEVDAVWSEGGLAVTPHQGWERTSAGPNVFDITHLPSGRSLGRLAMSAEEAIALARTVLPLADWGAMTAEDVKAAAKARRPWVAKVAEALARIPD